jgi:hypothetical protein
VQLLIAAAQVALAAQEKLAAQVALAAQEKLAAQAALAAQEKLATQEELAAQEEPVSAVSSMSAFEAERAGEEPREAPARPGRQTAAASVVGAA